MFLSDKSTNIGKYRLFFISYLLLPLCFLLMDNILIVKEWNVNTAVKGWVPDIEKSSLGKSYTYTYCIMQKR